MKDMNDKIGEFKKELIHIEELMHELIVQGEEFTQEYYNLERQQLNLIEILEEEGEMI